MWLEKNNKINKTILSRIHSFFLYCCFFSGQTSCSGCNCVAENEIPTISACSHLLFHRTPSSRKKHFSRQLASIFQFQSSPLPSVFYTHTRAVQCGAVQQNEALHQHIEQKSRSLSHRRRFWLVQKKKPATSVHLTNSLASRFPSSIRIRPPVGSAWPSSEEF